jgi:hypothetical protein
MGNKATIHILVDGNNIDETEEAKNLHIQRVRNRIL